MEAAYLLFTLLCPLSMLALGGWWFWSMRRSARSCPPPAPVRSQTEEAELARMRAQLDQLQAAAREAEPHRV